jgi:chromosome segregation ATPase
VTVELGRRKTACPDRLKERLGKLTAEAQRILKAFRAAKGGRKLLSGQLAALEVEMDELRRQITDADERIRRTEAARERLDDVVRLLDGFDEVWRVLVPDERRELRRRSTDEAPFENSCCSSVESL